MCWSMPQPQAIDVEEGLQALGGFDTPKTSSRNRCVLTSPRIDLPPVLIDVESVEGEDVVTCKEVVDLPERNSLSGRIQTCRATMRRRQGLRFEKSKGFEDKP